MLRSRAAPDARASSAERLRCERMSTRRGNFQAPSFMLGQCTFPFECNTLTSRHVCTALHPVYCWHALFVPRLRAWTSCCVRRWRPLHNEGVYYIANLCSPVARCAGAAPRRRFMDHASPRVLMPRSWLARPRPRRTPPLCARMIDKPVRTGTN